MAERNVFADLLRKADPGAWEDDAFLRAVLQPVVTGSHFSESPDADETVPVAGPAVLAFFNQEEWCPAHAIWCLESGSLPQALPSDELAKLGLTLEGLCRDDVRDRQLGDDRFSVWLQATRIYWADCHAAFQEPLPTDVRHALQAFGDVLPGEGPLLKWPTHRNEWIRWAI